MARSPHSTKTVWLRGLVATAIATATNVLAASAAATVVDAPPTFLALTPGPVAFVTVAAMTIGTLVFALLNRVSQHPMRWFPAIAVVVSLASLAAPLALAVDPAQAPARLGVVTASSALALIPLHLIPAAELIVGLAWRGRRDGARSSDEAA